MAEKKIVTLPITGMTCANCVATVERNLKKQDGVEGAAVNLSSERASVTYNPELTGESATSSCFTPTTASASQARRYSGSGI